MDRFQAGGLVKKIVDKIELTKHRVVTNLSLDVQAEAERCTDELIDTVLEHIRLCDLVNAGEQHDSRPPL